MRAVSFERTRALKQRDFLWVVIPCRNEEKNIRSCLDSFRRQSDRQFRLVVVVNDSTDRTAAIAQEWAEANKNIIIDIITEAKAGIGRACRIGCLLALSYGATMLARTDADGYVADDWVEQAKRPMLQGYDFVIGRCCSKPNEYSLVIKLKAALLMVLIRWLVTRQRQKKGLLRSSMVMTGANLSLTAELYQAVGGFTDRPVNEDVELHNRILERTTNGTFSKNMIVFTSLRRIKKMGLFGTLGFYRKKGEL